MDFVKLNLGDRVTLRKAHPCGSREFEVTRTGVDVKLRCLGCGRVIMDTRESIMKKIRSVTPAQDGQGKEDPDV